MNPEPGERRIDETGPCPVEKWGRQHVELLDCSGFSFPQEMELGKLDFRDLQAGSLYLVVVSMPDSIASSQYLQAVIITDEKIRCCRIEFLQRWIQFQRGTAFLAIHCSYLVISTAAAAHLLVGVSSELRVRLGKVSFLFRQILMLMKEKERKPGHGS